MTVATGIDIETTGLDVYSGHKIIEIALVSYELETSRKYRCGSIQDGI